MIVYKLKEDIEKIKNVQRATQTTDDFGIEPTHGMFGSDEWWGNIESGKLSTETVQGKITKVYMAGMNDWPEFKMMDESGAVSSWTRETNFVEQDQLYRIGAAIEIDYVWQSHRPKSFSQGAKVKQVIEIRIAN